MEHGKGPIVGGGFSRQVVILVGALVAVAAVVPISIVLLRAGCRSAAPHCFDVRRAEYRRAAEAVIARHADFRLDYQVGDPVAVVMADDLRHGRHPLWRTRDRYPAVMADYIAELRGEPKEFYMRCERESQKWMYR